MAGGLDVVGVDAGARPDLVDAIGRLANVDTVPVVDHDHGGAGYAVPDDATFAALTLAARTEGLVLDPVYTGKAMAALVTWAREGRLDSSACVCFWHTGGQPALFASRYQERFSC